jgi:hypothetical protein
VRGEEWLEVFISILDSFGLLGRLRCKEAEILGAVEIEFERRRMGLQKVTIVFRPSVIQVMSDVHLD